jgi:hypothetical protein
MALANNDLYSETTRAALGRIQPASGPGAVTAKPFAASSGAAATLAIGTPLAVNTSGFMIKLVPAGTATVTVNATPATYFAEQVYAIVWPAAVTIAASGGSEVVGSVMLRGSVGLKEVCDGLGVAVTDANTLLALRNPIVRERGIFIDDLTLSLG